MFIIIIKREYLRSFPTLSPFKKKSSLILQTKNKLAPSSFLHFSAFLSSLGNVYFITPLSHKDRSSIVFFFALFLTGVCLWSSLSASKAWEGVNDAADAGECVFRSARPRLIQ